MTYISAISVKNDVFVWEREEDGKRVKRPYPAPFYFYVDDPEGTYKTIFDTPVSKLTFKNYNDYYSARRELAEEGFKLWESDIPPELRVLSNHYYEVPATAKLHVTFFDIEVDYNLEMGFSSVSNPYAPINSVSLFHMYKNTMVVICVPPKGQVWDAESLRTACNDIEPLSTEYDWEFYVVQNERELLLEFLRQIEDTDVLSGWNSDFFDVPYVGKRLERMGGQAWLRRLSFPGAFLPEFADITDKQGRVQTMLRLSGRVSFDFLQLYKKYEFGERYSYKLSAIEEEVGLNLPKLEYPGSLHELYNNNFPFFVRYNIRDSEILRGFEQTLGYVDVATRMYHLSTGLPTHVLGTLKLAELAIVNYCHHVVRRVVPNITRPDIDRQIDGAFVLFPQIGLHEMVGSIDINSLYPSAMRSLNISPEMIRGQFTTDCEAQMAIANGTDDVLCLVYEDGTTEDRTASEWRDFLLDQKWAVSGYGTVFSQEKPGIIPSVLADWFATRKKYQALKKEFAVKVDKADNDEARENFNKQVENYDRLQYIYKIKLNSLYGALTNLYFRFYDLRMGESTTATGRSILKHQCRTVSKALGGEYDIEFPLWGTEEECIEHGVEPRWALHGPVFKGEYPSKYVIYGDTDSSYFITDATDLETAIEIADTVGEIVTASFPAYMRASFLCQPEYDGLIKSAREIVSDKGIFVQKKRYILHIADKEGKRVDELKVMGLDTKKTILPKDIAHNINGFIEKLLKGKTWNDLAEEIVEYKEHLVQSGKILKYGLPTGVNKVEEYMAAYLREGVKARLPGGAAAAVHYNLALQEHGDKVSLPIVSGMKIRKYYLKYPVGKFKTIALPTDLDQVPQWFLDHYPLDNKAMILRLIDNPISNIIKAIGREPPTRQTLLDTQLVEY